MKQLLRYSFLSIVMMLFVGNAAAKPFVTLSFPDENAAENKEKGNGYANTWTAKIGNYEWLLTNFNNYKWQNNWTYIRCGSKKADSEARIATAKKLQEAVATVVVDVDKMDKSLLNKVFLAVSADGTTAESIVEMPAEKWVTGPMVFTIPSPKADRYYAVYFYNKKGKSNGAVQISRVKYYTAGQYTGPASIKNTPATAYTIAKAQELAAGGEGLADSVYVKGFVTSVEKFEIKPKAWNNGTYWISDDKAGTNKLYIYAGRYGNGTAFTNENQLKVGDEVVVYGTLAKNTDHTLMDRGNYLYSVNGTVVTGIRATEITKKADKNAPLYNMAGQRVSKAYKGVVIQNGKKFVNK